MKIPLLNDNSLLNLDKEFRTWGTLSQHGPILLAWSCVELKINELTESTEFDPMEHGMKGLQLKPISFLLSMLKESQHSEEVTN